MISYEQFADNCARLKERVAKAAQSCGRGAAEIKILPVTKFHPLDAVRYAHKYGFAAVGENRVQEAADKVAKADFEISWELIGHLQSNKAGHAVKIFDRIQSADSKKLLDKIDTHARELGKTMRVLLQVNAGNDPAKFGADLELAPELAEYAFGLQNVRVEGLMTIAPIDSTLAAAAKCFANLRDLRDKLQRDFSRPLPELSMGMSGDLECAVEAGSTMIRVGTFLLGEREQ